MNIEQMVADLVNLLEGENAQISWAGTIGAYLSEAGLEPDSDPAEHLPALLSLEQRRRADLDDTLARLLDPADQQTPTYASDLLGKVNSSWFGQPSAGIARLRVALLRYLFEHDLEGATAEVEFIPGGYSCVGQTCLYLAGDYVDDPDALESLPTVFSYVSKRWSTDEHVADLHDGRYAGQLDTWTSQLEAQRRAPRAAVEAAWNERTSRWAESGNTLALVLSREAANEFFRAVAARAR
jgi:hypothetical protein